MLRIRVAELCVTDKKDVIVVPLVLPHSNDDITTNHAN